MNSKILFDEARRLRIIAEGLPFYKASEYENKAREVEHKAWTLRQQEINSLMEK